MNTLDWINASPATRNLYKKFWSLVGATPTITPQYFEISIAGSEYLTYNAKKLYLCLEAWFDAGSAGIGASVNAGCIQLNDESDAAVSLHLNNFPVWNNTGAALNYVINDIILSNFYFSRMIATVYSRVRFNGYKVTWP